MSEVILFFSLIALLFSSCFKVFHKSQTLFCLFGGLLSLVFIGFFMRVPLGIFEGHYRAFFQEVPYALFFKMVALLTLVSSFIFNKKEFFEKIFVKFSALLAVFILIEANHILTLFLGLELLSISLYIFMGLHDKTPNVIEASVKYFVVGVLSTAIFLFGLSLLYVEMDHGGLSQLSYCESLLSFAGFMLVIISLFIKLGVVPCQGWVPDIYQGLPHASLLFLTTLPFVGGVVVFYKIIVPFKIAFPKEATIILMVAGISSIVVGSFFGLYQQNIKRLLGYSSVTHVGWLLLSLVSNSLHGAFFFYVVIYLVILLILFLIFSFFEKKGLCLDTLDHVTFLAKESSFLNILILVCLFSLAGIPPLPGFFAKVMILKDLVDHHFYEIACLAVLGSVITCVYYLTIIQRLAMSPKEDEGSQKIPVSFCLFIVILISFVFYVSFNISKLYTWVGIEC